MLSSQKSKVSSKFCKFSFDLGLVLETMERERATNSEKYWKDLERRVH